MQPAIAAIHISKSFPGVRALTDVSVDFFPGEVHALLGENGAGKSTLIKILSGVYTATEGKITLNGREVSFQSPREALDAGISVIHQELSIAGDLTVAENMYLGAEPRRGGGIFLDRAKMNRDAQKVLDEMQVSIRSTDIARDLTAAQQQMVEIAKIITKKSGVVIMDEPTSSLSGHEIDQLFRQIRSLRDRGAAVIYISHRLKEIFEICDRFTVLRDGCYVTGKPVAETSEQELVASMVGREIKDYYNRVRHTPGEEMLRVENLSLGRLFRDVSFSARAGEILGVAGLVGAGRTEVMETVFGARKADSGRLFVRGKELSFESPADAIRAGIGMVTEDRRRTGLMLGAMVKDNIVLPSLTRHHRRAGFLDENWEIRTATDYVGKLRVKTPSIRSVVANLSGGNQQKVILAKWLVANSSVMILDEPTRGIDVNAKSEFYALMNDFVARGGSIVMVSSELPEILGISDRILVMREGRVSGELTKDATEQDVMALASMVTDAAAR